MAMGQTVYSVTQVNEHIKRLLDGDSTLSRIYVRGELSNYKKYPSGHHYFTLKDETGAMRCVMFRSSAVRLRFQPASGMKVIAFGRVTVFPRDGAYQLYVDALSPDGVGELYIAFEQLKQKLNAEGLFSAEHKKQLPMFPGTIGIITSSAGAAVHDMIRILGARWPMTQVKLLPVRVQGIEAPAELVGAIEYANRWRVADVLIVGRGGGSLEDLWAFNDEQVARAIYRSELPVISAVGHEPDVTIADFVADVRAATPSNAAELAVPDQNDVYAHLMQLQKRLDQSIQSEMNTRRRELEQAATSRVLTRPKTMVEDRRLLLDYQQHKMESAVHGTIGHCKQRFSQLAAGLEAMNPMKVLARGYAVAQTVTGEIITSVNQVSEGTQLNLQLSDGMVDCTVTGQKMLDRRGSNGSPKENV